MPVDLRAGADHHPKGLWVLAERLVSTKRSGDTVAGKSPSVPVSAERDGRRRGHVEHASLGGPNRADSRFVVTSMTYTRFLPFLMAALFIVLFLAACGGKGGGY